LAEEEVDVEGLLTDHQEIRMLRRRKINPELLEAFHEKGFSTPVIGVTGGKGGVGKTAVAVNVAVAVAEMGFNVALVDADVDNPNAGIITDMGVANPAEVQMTIPDINAAKCDSCGDCIRACRHHALLLPPDKSAMLIGDCNGCEACILVCQQEAIARGERLIGWTYKNSADNLILYTGELIPGLEESAAVVKALKNRVFNEAEQFDLIVVDTSPGIHCNVIAALQGADSFMAETEPTPLGAHDLDLVLQLLNLFQLPGKVVLNRADLPGNKKKIASIARRHRIPVAREIMTDEALLESYVEAVPIIRRDPAAHSAIAFLGLAQEIVDEYLA
ncbi:MAG: AAA family ATPase, partial [Deltaproteobacteria bacterium]